MCYSDIHYSQVQCWQGAIPEEFVGCRLCLTAKGIGHLQPKELIKVDAFTIDKGN